MPEIDPTARVHASARLGADVQVGPFCCVGPDVVIGDGCKLIANVHISGITSLGARCTVHPGAVLGGPPQALAYRGEPTRLEIGANCVIREHVTMDGTVEANGATRVGANGYFMTKSHVAHDCDVGEGAIFANGATLAGHCVLDANVFVSGGVMVHQFTHIGRDVIVGGGSIVIGDIAPFVRAFGAPARLVGVNLVGLKRRACPPQSLRAIRTGYRTLFLSAGTLKDRLDRLERDLGEDPYVAALLEFVKRPRKRPLCAARQGRPNEAASEGVDEGGD